MSSSENQVASSPLSVTAGFGDWEVDDRLRMSDLKQVWVVRQVVERGVVVTTLNDNSHRHLLEWSWLKDATKLSSPNVQSEPRPGGALTQSQPTKENQ